MEASVPAMRGLKERARAPKAGAVLASEIRRRIIGEGLQPGTPLPSEAQLIEQSGTSRATVREALRLLESEGLVEVKRGARGGVSVRHPDAGHVASSLALLLTLGEVTWRQLFEFRLLVEPGAASSAARNATDEQRAALLAAAEAEGNGNVERHPHHAFHILLAASSGNHLLAVVLAAVEQAVAWLAADEQLDDWDIGGGTAAHQRIARAVAEGNAGSAERSMRKHLLAFQAQAEALGRIDQPLLPRSRWSALGNRSRP